MPLRRLQACLGLAFMLASVAEPAPVLADPAGHWTVLPPLGRVGHTLIRDGSRDRMIMIGGGDTSGEVSVLARPLDGSGEWTDLGADEGPGPRFFASIVHDSIGDRVLLFGGRRFLSQGPFFNDVWALSLNGSPSWSQITPSGAAPEPRSGAVAVFDPSSQRMFLFGGDVFSQDVWTLTLAGSAVWERLDIPPGPTARFQPVAILDEERRQFVMFGGLQRSGNVLLGETWTLLLDEPEWFRVFTAASGPSARYACSAVYDSGRQSMLMFGGLPAPLSDVWELSLAGKPDWLPVTASGSGPGGRQRHGAIFDPLRSRMVIVGGHINNTSLLTARIHALRTLPGFEWNELAGIELPGFGAAGTHTTYDPLRDRLLSLGADAYLGPMIRAMRFQSAGLWETLQTAPLAPRVYLRQANVAYDPVRDRLIFFSGTDLRAGSSSFVRDAWALNFWPSTAWESLAVSGTRPAARTGAMMCFDPLRDRMVLFGGADGLGQYLGDLWELPLSGPLALTWSALSPAGAPPLPRRSGIMFHDPYRDEFVVAGGTGASGALADVWRLSPEPNSQWVLMHPFGTPPQSFELAGAYDPQRDRLVIRSSDGEGALTASLSFALPPRWTTAVPTGERYSGRANLMSFDTARDRLLAFGGASTPRHFVHALEFGQSVNGILTGPGEFVWTPGHLDMVEFTLVNPFAFAQRVRWVGRDERGWLGPSSTGAAEIGPLDSTIIQVPVPVPEFPESGVNVLTLVALLQSSMTRVETRVSLHDALTPALVSVARATAEPAVVRLEWDVALPPRTALEIERTRGGNSWGPLASRRLDGTRRVGYEDHDVEPGARYGYRIRYLTESGPAAAGEVWVQVPRELEFGVIGARPNPNSEDLALSFALPVSEPARIQLLDLAGREVRVVELDRPEPGTQFVRLDPDRRLAAGVYFCRLTQGPRQQTRKVAVVR